MHKKLADAILQQQKQGNKSKTRQHVSETRIPGQTQQLVVIAYYLTYQQLEFKAYKNVLNASKNYFSYIIE